MKEHPIKAKNKVNINIKEGGGDKGKESKEVN